MKFLKTSRALWAAVLIAVTATLGLGALAGRPDTNKATAPPQDQGNGEPTPPIVNADKPALPVAAQQPAQPPADSTYRTKVSPLKVAKFTIGNLEVTLFAVNQSNPTDSFAWQYSPAAAARATSAKYDEKERELTFTIDATVNDAVLKRAAESLVPRYQAAGKTDVRADQIMAQLTAMPVRHFTVSISNPPGDDLLVDNPKPLDGGFFFIGQPLHYSIQIPQDDKFEALHRRLSRDPASVHLTFTSSHLFEYYKEASVKTEQIQTAVAKAKEKLMPGAGATTRDPVFNVGADGVFQASVATELSRSVESPGDMKDEMQRLLEQLARPDAGRQQLAVSEMLDLLEEQVVGNVVFFRDNARPDRLVGKTFDTESINRQKTNIAQFAKSASECARKVQGLEKFHEDMKHLTKDNVKFEGGGWGVSLKGEVYSERDFSTLTDNEKQHLEDKRQAMQNESSLAQSLESEVILRVKEDMESEQTRAKDLHLVRVKTGDLVTRWGSLLYDVRIASARDIPLSSILPLQPLPLGAESHVENRLRDHEESMKQQMELIRALQQKNKEQDTLNKALAADIDRLADSTKQVDELKNKVDFLAKVTEKIEKEKKELLRQIAELTPKKDPIQGSYTTDAPGAKGKPSTILRRKDAANGYTISTPNGSPWTNADFDPASRTLTLSNAMVANVVVGKNGTKLIFNDGEVWVRVEE